jgi:hypothetical protein
MRSGKWGRKRRSEMNPKNDNAENVVASLHKAFCSKYSSSASAHDSLKVFEKCDSYDFELQPVYDKLANAFINQHNKCISPSEQNWRWKSQKKISPDNQGEKVLEKMVVIQQPEGKDLLWANQVPVVSGVFSSTANKKRAIDLVFCKGNGVFEFIELKTEAGTNNPVYAAREILLYGILYVFYRNQALGQSKSNSTKKILKAKSISLIAAAPHNYFKGYKHLKEFQAVLSSQLSVWVRNVITGVTMDFRFEAFDYEDPKEINDRNVKKFLLKQPL